MEPESEPNNEDSIRAWAAATGRAGEFDEEGDVARRYLLNPTIFALLGDLRGKKVLDAGCGQGYLSRLLARRGAHVTGVEPAGGWYHHAVQLEEIEPLGITYVQTDLSRWIQAPSTFDAVIANMVFMDIADYRSAMVNCIAALMPGGRLVFSLVHPCFEESGSGWSQKRYVEVREYLQEHVRPQTFAPLFHRPLSAYLNLVIDSGCSITRICEPRLELDIARQLGNDRDVHVPSFIVVAATKF